MLFARRSALAIGTIGLVFFALAFLASIDSPGFVEKSAKNVIRYQVEKEVHKKIEAIDSHFLSKKAAVLAPTHADDIAETNIREGFVWRIANTSVAQERLTMLIRSKYMETASKLPREFRIFTGTNMIVFTLLPIAVRVKRQAGIQLLPAASVLFLAASVTAYMYLFNQNWLHTLVFSDFVGLTYFAYLCGVFALLCDIMFNWARVTVKLVNVALNGIGSAVQATPC